MRHPFPHNSTHTLPAAVLTPSPSGNKATAIPTVSLARAPAVSPSHWHHLAKMVAAYHCHCLSWEQLQWHHHYHCPSLVTTAAAPTDVPIPPENSDGPTPSLPCQGCHCLSSSSGPSYLCCYLHLPKALPSLDHSILLSIAAPVCHHCPLYQQHERQ